MMQIKKRNGVIKEFDPNKILNRIKVASQNLTHIDIDKLFMEVNQGLISASNNNLLTTKEIDNLICQYSISKTPIHYEYGTLANNIKVSSLHKEFNFKNYKERFRNILDKSIFRKINDWEVKPNYESDFDVDYFSTMTFLKNYSLKVGGYSVEVPCEMYFRVALYLSDDKESFLHLYSGLYKREIITASPILFNAGFEKASMISCALHTLKEDSLEGIYDTFKNVGKASKSSAGIGLYISDLRSSYSRVNEKGKASGVVKFCKMLEPQLEFFNQNGNRKGACAVYLDIWHSDVEHFLELRLQSGNEKMRTRDLFTGIVLNDLFCEKVKKDEDWHLFCPFILKQNNIELINVWGDEFKENYKKAVEMGLYNRVVKAQDLIKLISYSRVNSGLPYILHRDNVNKSNNQNNYGVIKSSNLCIEYISYSDKDSEAQCCVASVIVSAHIKEDNTVDYESIIKASELLCKTLNSVLDKNTFSTEIAALTSQNQRSIGIGIIDLAGLFFKLNIPFDSDEALTIQKNIQECIYYGAVNMSNKLQKKERETKDELDYSPYSWKDRLKINETQLGKGKFHFEHYNYGELFLGEDRWNELRENVLKYGIHNSLLVVNLPSASTSILCSKFESFEPIESNIFVRETDSGTFVVVNKYLIDSLEKMDLWNEKTRTDLLMNEGSIQNIPYIPNSLKNVFKTTFEIKQKRILEMAAARQPFIDQAISMNLYFKNPDINSLVASTLYSWELGLKTGVYYTKTKSQLKADKNLGIAKTTQIKTEADNSISCFGCT